MHHSNKKIFYLFFLVVLIAGCSSFASIPETEGVVNGMATVTAPETAIVSGFVQAERQEWFLVEIRSPSQNVVFNRDELDAEGFAGVYTINFDNGHLSGMGSPNRYFSSYESGDSGTLTIANIASTMMFSHRQPGGLMEGVYFDLLSMVSRWDYSNNRLELYTVQADGDEAVMVFILRSSN